MKRKVVMFLTCLFIGIGLASAQVRTVHGNVTSAEDGLPVVGASVLVDGTTLGTVTDIDGNFSISNVPNSAKTLTISYIGMKSQQIAIRQGANNVVLEAETENLDEVVVVAQGLTRKDKSVGYSTTKIGGDKLTIARQTDLGNSMAGKIAGARFFGSSGATFDAGSIVLRGSSDFTDIAGSEPIYVVDGTITNKSAVNMDDVESINVLKGPAATALYGSEGGNGAVLITTKSVKGERGHIEVSHTIAFESYYNHFNMQKLYGGGSYASYGESNAYVSKYGDQYDTMSAEFLYGVLGGQTNADGSYYIDYGDDENWGARYDKNVKVASALYYDPTSPKYGIADPWVHQLDLGDMLRTGVSNTTNVAFSKAGKDYSTRISFTNSYREGVMENSDATRRYLAIKNTFKPVDWLNVNLDYKFTYRRNHNAAGEGYGEVTNPIYDFLQWGQGNVNLKDYKDYARPDGTWRTWNIKDISDLTANFHDNPFAIMNEFNNYETEQWNVFTGDVEALLPYNFKAGFRVNGNLKNYNKETRRADGSINALSSYAEEQYHTRDLYYQGRLTWGNHYFDDRLAIDAAAFIEQRNYNYGTLTGSTQNGLVIPGFYNLSASSGTANTSNTERHFKTRSIFGNATVGWDDTYFLDASIRRDWDSRLPETHNGFTYGGLSASVMLNKFINAKWLNYWKLRASMAQVGSTLDVYSIHPVYTVKNSDNITYKYNTLTYLYAPSTLRNPNIKPTISTSYEIGTEFKLFENRFWGDINLYRRDSKNQIMNVYGAPQSGYNSTQVNAGLVRNQGIEISLGGMPIRTRNFSWSIDGNIARNLNKLVRLDGDPTHNDTMLYGNGFGFYFYKRAIVGEPIGVLTTMCRVARTEDGKPILTESTSNAWGGGYALTREANVEKKVGNFQPDWMGGFGTSLQYKNVLFGVSGDFMIGGQMVSWTNLWSTGSGLNTSTAKLNDKGVNEREPVLKDGGVHVQGVINKGTADNPQYEDVDCYMNAYQYYHYIASYDQDEWIYKRTYVKIRELSLGYSFPQSLLQKAKIGLSSASLSFVATNPWLIYSACPNLDASESGNDYLEGGQAISTRTFGFTVKLGF